MPQYALGPWQWLTMEDPEAGRGSGWSYWGPPAGTIASVDLRPRADRERRSWGDMPHGLFVVQDGIRVPSEYQLLGTDRVSLDAWESLVGYRPQGDTVERCLYDLILHGDPSDLDRCNPLLPTTRGTLDLHLRGLAVREQFRYGVHPHTATVRDMARRKIREQYEYDSATRGDITLTRKVLDYELAKYRIPVEQWQELVPTDLQSEIQGPLPRTTAIGDNFNRDNADITAEPSSDGDWSWTNIENDLRIFSNTVIQDISNTNGASRAGKDLSGSDQRAEIEVSAFGSNSAAHVGVIARCSSSAFTGYICLRLGTSASNHLRLYSVSSGTRTEIDASASQPTIVAIQVDSTSISSYNDTTEVNTVTNMAVSSGLRAGIVVRPGGIATAFSGDNFAAEDLEAGGSHTLEIPAALQGQVVNTPTLSQEHMLAADGALLGQTADTPDLAQDHTLAINAALAGQIADTPDLVQDHQLSIDGALLGQLVDQVDLITDVVLEIDAGLIGQTVSMPDLTQDHQLVVDESLLGQAVDQVDLIADVVLEIDASILGQVVSLPALTQDHQLLVPGSLLGQLSPEITLVSGGPTDLPVTDGLVWNLDAGELDLSDGDPVATWGDASPSGNDVSQATESKRPTYRTGQTPTGGPTVRFDGTDDDLKTTTTPIEGSGDRTIYIVFRQSSAHVGTRPSPVCLSPDGAGAVQNRFGITTEYAVRVSGANRIWDQGATADQWEMLTIRLSGGNCDGLTAWRNWQQLSVASTTNGGSALSTAAGGAAVGLYNLLDEWFAGDVSHILAYEGAHTDEQRLAMHAYLWARWLASEQTLVIGASLLGQVVDVVTPMQVVYVGVHVGNIHVLTPSVSIAVGSAHTKETVL